MKRLADSPGQDLPDITASQTAPWQAMLALGFARDGEVTRLVDRRHNGPLRVQKPLYPETPAVCHAIVVHPPGGIVGGDQLSVQVEVAANAHAFITSPGAAKWYRANGRRSGQRLQLKVGAGASLEWMPQETILYDEAEVELQCDVELAEDATWLGCEILCFGRTASGERFHRGSVRQSTRIRRGTRLLWSEQGRLQAGSRDMESPVGLGGATVCATFLSAGAPVAAGVIAALREELDVLGPKFGVTQLKQVIAARYLGHSSEEARAVMLAVWRALRAAQLGLPAVTPRIWNT